MLEISESCKRKHDDTQGMHAAVIRTASAANKADADGEEGRLLAAGKSAG
ncbi:hypothetical protein FHT76_004304 [Rhizobium sp. BK176]|nr:hypothetical protein [Rhizobium sp. BK176]